MNPLLPFEYCIPDGEAHVMNDGRLYLYGSMDIPGKMDYCCDRYHVFSTDDMVHWTDHGESFSSDDAAMRGLFPEGTGLYAPDAAEKDGKTYLYFCTSGSGEGVAVSDSPAGPFSALNRLDGADGVSIDPAVFVDDDGQAYYFWGQFRLHGAKLNADMRSLDLSTHTEDILTEFEHGFHEGSSLRKHNGLYYMVYTDISRGKATCLGYATAPSPLGPYTKRGILVDNAGCDPDTWNDHGSIECFRGQWYVFYHRSSEGSRFSRRMCAEPIEFAEDGSIREVPMTVGGAEGPADAGKTLLAARAVRMAGETHVTLDAQYGPLLACSGNGPTFGWMRWALYPDLRFDGSETSCTVVARGHASLRLMTERGVELGRCRVDSETFAPVTAAVTPVEPGVRPLWLVFEEGSVDVQSLRFI